MNAAHKATWHISPGGNRNRTPLNSWFFLQTPHPTTIFFFYSKPPPLLPFHQTSITTNFPSTTTQPQHPHRPKMLPRSKLLRCVFTISIGGAVIGIDEGIIATVIAQASFSKYMFPPNTKIPQQQQKQRGNTLLGAIGSLSAGFILAKYGRKAL